MFALCRYTMPAVPQAGQPLDVYYCPDASTLRGRPETFATVGFNRWSHGQKVTQRMAPTLPGGIGYVKCTIDVPQVSVWARPVFGLLLQTCQTVADDAALSHKR